MIHATRTPSTMHSSTLFQMLLKSVEKQETIHHWIFVTTIKPQKSTPVIGEFESVTCHILVELSFNMVFFLHLRWDHWGLKIDTGCSASCTGCSFYPTEVYTGPGLLECTEGDCYNYSVGPHYNDCGEEIQDASEEWGSISLSGHRSNGGQVFSGFNNITTTDAIMIDQHCTLDCSSGTFKKLRAMIRLGTKRQKTHHNSDV